jgi:hypothetical protein
MIQEKKYLNFKGVHFSNTVEMAGAYLLAF